MPKSDPNMAVTSRVDLRALWGERGVGPSERSAFAGEQEQVVEAVLDRVSREHADLLAQDLLSDPFVGRRLNDALRETAQGIARASEIERVVRLAEARIFSLGDLSEVLSDPDVLEIQMIGPDYATSRRKSASFGRDPLVRFLPGTDPVKELQHFAQLYKHSLDQTTPYATFMAGPWRVSIHIPPHITAPFSLTMRRGIDEHHTLTAQDFLRLGTLDAFTLETLYALVDSYQTLLTFAPQRSGKTWLQRILIDHMDPQKGAILLIEDIPEIQPAIPVLNFYAVDRDEKPITMLKLSEWSLRESAVYVVLGEFRQQEAAAFIDLTQQGTAGLTTGHGGSPVQITNRLVDAYLAARPSTTEASAYRKVHQAVGFYVEMRRYVEPLTQSESFRLQAIYEVLPTQGPVTERHYRPLVRYRFQGFDPVTHGALGRHEAVGRMSRERYEDCLLRSSHAVEIPASIRPEGARRRVSMSAGALALDLGAAR